MNDKDLEALDDAGLQGVISRAEQLLKDRAADRRQQAIDEAKARLASVGLTFRDVVGKSKGPAKPGAATGTKYINPADPSQTYTTGRGRPPKWFAALQAKGKLPEPAKK